MPHRKERRGRPKCNTPAEHRAYYDRRFGFGFSEQLIEDSKRYSCPELLKRYSARTDWTKRQSVHYALTQVTGRPNRKDLKRPDVTVRRVRALARILPSAKAIAEACGTWTNTVKTRARQGGFDLPKGRKKLRLDIPPHRLRRFARQEENVLAIARHLKCHPGTVVLRARKYGIRLPNDKGTRQARSTGRQRRVRYYRAKKGFSYRKIALIIGISHTQARKDFRRYVRIARERQIAS